jgi:hypothetical protein
MRPSYRIVFAFAAVLAAALVDPAGAADNEYANIRTIAVISALGNNIDMQTAGPRFGAEDYTLHADWNFDNQVADDVEKGLAPHFTVKKAIAAPQVYIVPSAFGGVDLHAIWERARALPDAGGVDGYVLVIPYDSTDINSRGLVVTRYPGLFGSGTTALAALYQIVVLDAVSGNRIDYSTSQRPASGYLSGHAPPWDTCPNTIWADAENQLTADQKARIRFELSSLIGHSIFYTLMSANLMSKDEAAKATAQLAPATDPACHEGLL